MSLLRKTIVRESEASLSFNRVPIGPRSRLTACPSGRVVGVSRGDARAVKRRIEVVAGQN